MTRPHPPSERPRFAALFLLLAALAGCDLPRAMGDQNAFIVGTDAALWGTIEEGFLDAMEPTIQTVTNERPFRITWQDTADERNWAILRTFRQVVVIGTAEDPWVSEAIAATRGELPPAPGVFQVENVWARGQLVSVLLLSRTGATDEVARFTPQLRDLLDEQFRTYARSRMYVSGQNLALEDSLFATVGFSLALPEVYRHSSRDSVFKFRNDNPTPAELIREVVVTWEAPAPQVLPTAEAMELWREGFVQREFSPPQLLDPAIVSYGPIEVNGLEGVQFQSAWVSPPDAWPAGGPFITRALRCPSQDRLYWIDAWLYAPNRDKYEYMIQLETILDTFRCR